MKTLSGKDCPGNCGEKILSVNKTCGSPECNEMFFTNDMNGKGIIYDANIPFILSTPMPVEKVQD